MANLFSFNEAFYSNIRTLKDRTKVTMDVTKFLKQDRVGITQVVPFIYGYAHTEAVAIGNYGSHQLGSQYGKSPETCVMPSRKRLEETGNPYPLDITSIENVGSDKRFCEPKYRNLVVMQYYVWEYLLNGTAYSAMQLFDCDELVQKAEAEVTRQLGKGYCYDRKTVIDRNLFASQLMHTLRDLEYCGLAIASKEGLRKLATPFAVQPAILDAVTAGRDKATAKSAAKATSKAASKPKASKATLVGAKVKAAVEPSSEPTEATTEVVDVVSTTEEVANTQE